MKETILSLEKEAMERWRNGDPWGFVEISAEDITYVDPGLTTPILGLEEFKAYMKPLEGKIRYQGSEFIDPRIIVAGDAAVLSYNYRSSVITPEGTTISQTPWNATEVYFRRDDQWRIVHTHPNVDCLEVGHGLCGGGHREAGGQSKARSGGGYGQVWDDSRATVGSVCPGYAEDSARGRKRPPTCTGVMEDGHTRPGSSPRW